MTESEEGTLDEAAFDRVMRNFVYVQADFDDDAAWQRVADAVQASGTAIGSKNALFYLAIAPEQFLNVCQRLAGHGLLTEDGGWRRVVVEKPFGTDFASARELNRGLTSVMREEQIYRIDHYLGKETVQNIMVFRFGNGIFEPIWNRRYVDHVQITVAESLGVELRGGYYDQTGALRDMVPNHLFQILTLTAMEPPSSLEAHALHNEQVKVLEAIEPLSMSESSAEHGSCPVRGGAAQRQERARVSRGAEGEPGIAHRNLCRVPDCGGQLALGRRAVLPAHRQTAQAQEERGGHPVPAAAAGALPRSVDGRRPNRTSW